MIRFPLYLASVLVAALLFSLQPAYAAQVDAPPDPVVVRGNTFLLRSSLTTGVNTSAFNYGAPGDYPVFGDWNGDGVATVGVVRGNTWMLRNSNSAGPPDITFVYGLPGDIPVAGDWNGDGVTTPGVVRGNQWSLRNSNTAGGANIVFTYGLRSDKVVTGDWNGDGTTTPGVVRGNIWYLRNSNTSGNANLSFGYGLASDKPIAGDWDGDGDTTPGVIRGNQWLVRNSNTPGGASTSFHYGRSCDVATTTTQGYVMADRGGRTARSSLLGGREISVLPTSSKVVALTFDAGGDAQGLTSILSTLDRYCVPATFFLVGYWMRAHPELSRQIGLRYPVGNHTDGHPHITTPPISDANLRTQITTGTATVLSATRYHPLPLFRFPYGERNAHYISVVNSLGYVDFYWTVDTLGWKGTSGGQTVDSVVSRVVNTLRPGQIVLLHVGANPDDRSTLDADALPRIITELRARGYGFVTLPQFV